MYLAEKHLFVKSAKRAWEITKPYDFKCDGLKPIPFIVFEITPPDRTGSAVSNESKKYFVTCRK